MLVEERGWENPGKEERALLCHNFKFGNNDLCTCQGWRLFSSVIRQMLLGQRVGLIFFCVCGKMMG